MASTRDIRRRIKSVGNTQKITRAMEMVSAAKMRKSVASVLAVRPYAHAAWSVLTNLSRAFEKNHAGLLEVREVKNVLAIAITSNKGLCGAFNAQIIKKIKDEIANPERLSINRVGKEKLGIKNKNIKIDFITIGKKGEAVVRKAGKDIIASFNELTYLPKIDDVRVVGKVVTEDYLAKKYDKVVVFYTDYVSAMSQQTKVRQILPISKIDLEKQIAEMDVLAKEYGLDAPVREYKVEPNPESVLEYILPRLIDMQIYHAILESNAAKESTRMMAMRSATDAAGEMKDDLTFVYNQIRQMKITQEIAEISAGRAALEN
ncbi:MAG: ATP synthase F1 subunit gamma [Candidatus Moranbacteria bacterium]|nr:ATP synthase F1 subunit gamma [Candidatus Moranbacteria bacterium]